MPPTLVSIERSNKGLLIQPPGALARSRGKSLMG